MKLLFPVAIATFAALASAGGGGGDRTDECSDEAAKVPLCANDCVNNEAAKFCDSGDYECICATETMEKIFDGSADCVAEACKDAGPVFPPLRDYCQCLVPDTTPPTSTTSEVPAPTSTCSAEEEKIPECAQSCVNDEAYKYCEPGELECSCAPETLEKIIEGAADCVAKACKDAGPVFPPLRDWCECQIGDDDDDDTTTTSAPVEPTETSTSTTAEPTASETSEPVPPTSTSEPATPTQTPVEPPTETTCAADETTTVTVTNTVCETSQPGSPQYPTNVPVPPSTSTPAVPPPPGYTGAAAITQRNAGLVAGVVAVVAGAAYL